MLVSQPERWQVNSKDSGTDNLLGQEFHLYACQKMWACVGIPVRSVHTATYPMSCGSTSCRSGVSSLVSIFDNGVVMTAGTPLICCWSSVPLSLTEPGTWPSDDLPTNHHSTWSSLPSYKVFVQSNSRHLRIHQQIHDHC